MLSEPYGYEKAKIIVWEMADNIVMHLEAKGLVTELITLDIDYDGKNCERTGTSGVPDSMTYTGDVKSDHYNRLVPKPIHGSMRPGSATNLSSTIINSAVRIFEEHDRAALWQ